LQRKSLNNKIMEAVVQQNYQAHKHHSLDEFADKLAKKIGRHYEMNDIREREKLIDSEWKEQPMRPWSEVYAELCCEVGQAYGLNDIREA